VEIRDGGWWATDGKRVLTGALPDDFVMQRALLVGIAPGWSEAPDDGDIWEYEFQYEFAPGEWVKAYAQGYYDPELARAIARAIGIKDLHFRPMRNLRRLTQEEFDEIERAETGGRP
jgi:hypothetical protein